MEPTLFSCIPAIPHRLMEDDVYNGYFLPKNAIVLGNAWYAVLWPRRVHKLTLNRVFFLQGNPARRQALPRSLHIQAGALYRTRCRPARSCGRGIRFRLWAASLPRPLDGPLLCLGCSGERALCLPHRKSRARRSRYRTHRRLLSWNPRVRSFFLALDVRGVLKETSLQEP